MIATVASNVESQRAVCAYAILLLWPVCAPQARSPSYHPGDVRVLQLVEVPELAALKDVLVFPVQGQRPHADECSGGGLMAVSLAAKPGSSCSETVSFWDSSVP